MVSRIQKFIADESGATAVEYSLIGALITLAAVVALKDFSNTFANVLTSADTAIGG